MTHEQIVQILQIILDAVAWPVLFLLVAGLVYVGIGIVKQARR